jgi:hypothetical protein
MSSLFLGSAVPGAYEAAVRQYGSQTVAQYFASLDNHPTTPGAAAVGSLGTSVVFLNYNNISASDVYGNAANVMHESLHNLLRLSDGGLMLKLSRAGYGVDLNGPSSQISDLIKQNCL